MKTSLFPFVCCKRDNYLLKHDVAILKFVKGK